jgi:hypothetical protein
MKKFKKKSGNIPDCLNILLYFTFHLISILSLFNNREGMNALMNNLMTDL